jgi:hypothetical protein
VNLKVAELAEGEATRERVLPYTGRQFQRNSGTVTREPIEPHDCEVPKAREAPNVSHEPLEKPGNIMPGTVWRIDWTGPPDRKLSMLLLVELVVEDIPARFNREVELDLTGGPRDLDLVWETLEKSDCFSSFRLWQERVRTKKTHELVSVDEVIEIFGIDQVGLGDRRRVRQGIEQSSRKFSLSVPLRMRHVVDLGRRRNLPSPKIMRKYRAGEMGGSKDR